MTRRPNRTMAACRKSLKETNLEQSGKFFAAEIEKFTQYGP